MHAAWVKAQAHANKTVTINMRVKWLNTQVLIECMRKQAFTCDSVLVSMKLEMSCTIIQADYLFPYFLLQSLLPFSNLNFLYILLLYLWFIFTPINCLYYIMYIFARFTKTAPNRTKTESLWTSCSISSSVN